MIRSRFGQTVLGASVIALALFDACALAPLSSDAPPSSNPTPSKTPEPISSVATVAPTLSDTSPGVSPEASPTATSYATETPEPRPLSSDLSEIPHGEFTYLKDPESRPGSLEVGESRDMRLEHCGLGSPIDVDGSLWDPKYGDDGNGGPLTDDQLIDLHNEGPITFTLAEPDVARISTRHGANLTLWRHDGPRRYVPCA